MNPAKKILLCFGTRPEAIKMAPVYHELRQSPFEVKVCVSAQHREMLDQVLRFFEITPDYDLNLMQPNQTLNNLGSLILSEMDKVLIAENPDLVLVHGDTTTSAMVALAAFHRNIKIGHVEAGLRTYNKSLPYPEEINRQLTGRLADWHFAPTQLAHINLTGEGVAVGNIIVTGNTVIDALCWTDKKLRQGFTTPDIDRLEKLLNKKTVLVTGHRRESFGEGFANICAALLEIAARGDVQIVFPVHLNPNIRQTVQELLSESGAIALLPPVDYPTMVWLMKKSALIISDSGGIQEEAPTFGKTILVTREVSERPEGVDSGFSVLVGHDKRLIAEKANHYLDHPFTPFEPNPYGDGTAAKKIVGFLSRASI